MPEHGHEHHGDHAHDHGGHGQGGGHSHAGHSHGSHSHAGHVHAPASFGWAFAIGIVLNTSFVAAEAIYGVMANSLALLADAGHNLGDVLGLGVAWLASWLASRPPSARFTYGLRGSSILAALSNATVLLLVTGAIAWEAVLRFNHPQPAVGTTIMIVAAGGVLINGATALMFMSGRKTDLNIRGAFTHMASDALIALGVVATGGLILLTGWLWLDPAISLAISAVVIWGTWSLMRESLNLALAGVPVGVDHAVVREFLCGLTGVTEVHDLHIWGMSTTETALTAHLVRPHAPVDDAFLHDVCAKLKSRFGIGHATLQLERGGEAEPCVLAPEHTV